MSQDYFLKKTYDTVYGANKPKSPFRSLSESYRLVYEQEEQQIHFDVNNVSSGKWTLEQQEIYRPSSSSNTPEDLYPELEEKTGAGPGEYSVASLLLGTTNVDKCNKLVSGQNKDWDLTWPDAKSKHPKYTFEVKSDDKGAVRIAKHGAKFTKSIYDDVDKILNTIIDEYDILGEEDKRYVSDYIISHTEELKEPGKRAGEKTRGTYQQKLQHRTGWSVDKWAHSIKNDRNELPFSILFRDGYVGVNREGHPVMLSIKRFASIINDIEENEQEEVGEEHPKETEENPRVTAVKKVFKHYYSAPSSEKSSILDQEIERTAKEVDKKLIKSKVHITGEGKSSWREFFRELSKANILEKIDKIHEKINSAETIESLFPKHLTGLFVVNINGYTYIPHDELKNNILITTISSGGPKIVLKKHKEEHEA